jgi:hypothetical protein
VGGECILRKEWFSPDLSRSRVKNDDVICNPTAAQFATANALEGDSDSCMERDREAHAALRHSGRQAGRHALRQACAGMCRVGRPLPPKEMHWYTSLIAVIAFSSRLEVLVNEKPVGHSNLDHQHVSRRHLWYYTRSSKTITVVSAANRTRSLGPSPPPPRPLRNRSSHRLTHSHSLHASSGAATAEAAVAAASRAGRPRQVTVRPEVAPAGPAICSRPETFCQRQK